MGVFKPFIYIVLVFRMFLQKNEIAEGVISCWKTLHQKWLKKQQKFWHQDFLFRPADTDGLISGTEVIGFRTGCVTRLIPTWSLTVWRKGFPWWRQVANSQLMECTITQWDNSGWRRITLRFVFTSHILDKHISDENPHLVREDKTRIQLFGGLSSSSGGSDPSFASITLICSNSCMV